MLFLLPKKAGEIILRHKDYWAKRFEMLENAQNNKAQEYYYNLQEQYRKAIDSVEKDLAKWYTRYATENKISLTEAKRLLNSRELAEFRMSVDEYIEKGKTLAYSDKWAKQLEAASVRVHVSRLEALKVQMQQQAEMMGAYQMDALDKLARTVYTDGYYHTAYELQKGIGVGWDLMRLDTNKIDKLISKPWAADGKVFSERVWGNTAQLVSELETKLTQSIIRGQSPKKAISEIAHRFNVSKSKAGRLVMTESAFFASAAQKDCYNDLGVEQFEILATLDTRTSEICRSMDGKVTPMSEYKPGVTAPPFHVWCRSTTVPYFDDEFTVDEMRAARDESGKYYLVPASMKYNEWFDAFVKGGSKAGLTVATAADLAKERLESLTALKQEIVEKHEKIINNDEQKKEFSDIIELMDEERATMYNKLAENFSNNQYYKKRTGWYSPSKRIIEMDLGSAPWEARMGRNTKGAWKTKFHEEMHQLDHILGTRKSQFAKYDGIVGYAADFTNTKTVTGKKLIAAIDEDVLNLINKAIAKRNEFRTSNGLDALKYVKGLDGRIAADAKDSLFNYLADNYPTAKARAMIDTVTDAIGLTTGGRIHPYKQGYWGHDLKYCKARGKDGATSEAWANLAGFMLRGDKEALDAVAELMPKTIEAYKEVFDEVLEYAKNNDLKYQ